MWNLSCVQLRQRIVVAVGGSDANTNGRGWGWATALAALALLPAMSCVQAVSSSGECTLRYEASLSQIDASTGEILKSRSVGWPSGQPLLRRGRQLLTVETQGNEAALTSWSPALARTWSTPLPGGSFVQGVATRDGRALITGERSVSVVSLASGELAWSRSFGSDVGPAALSEEAALVPNGRALTALSPGTGEELWRRRFPSHPVTPVVAGDAAVSGASRPSHGSNPGPLVARSTSTGEVLWKSAPPSPDSFRPRVLLTEGSVVDLEAPLGGAGLDLIGLDGQTGAPKWRRSFARRGLWDTVEARDNLLLVQRARSRVDALNAANGTTESVFRLKDEFLTDWRTSENDVMLALAAERSSSVARFTRTGAEVWRARLAGSWVPRVDLEGGVLYALLSRQGERGSRVVAVDPRSGSVEWGANFGQPEVGPVVRLGDNLFVLASDHRVGCI